MRRRDVMVAGASLAMASAQAQDFPTGPVRGIVPFAPGSATDTVARLFAERMREVLGQPVVIENRAGASGLIGAEAVARSAPDGMTLLFGTNSTNAAANALFRRVPFDMERDFTPVALLASVPLLVAVPESSPHRTLAELLTAARARPEAVTFASTSSSQRVASEMMASMAGVRLLHVPYRAAGAAMQDLLAGRVDMFVADQAVLLPAIQSGRARVLAVTTRTRSPQLPQTPTVAEAANLPQYEIFAWFVVATPAGTPAPVVARLNAAIRHAGENADLRQRMQETLGMVMMIGSPEEALAFTRSETVKWTQAIRSAGIEPE